MDYHDRQILKSLLRIFDELGAVNHKHELDRKTVKQIVRVEPSDNMTDERRISCMTNEVSFYCNALKCCGMFHEDDISCMKELNGIEDIDEMIAATSRVRDKIEYIFDMRLHDEKLTIFTVGTAIRACVDGALKLNKSGHEDVLNLTVIVSRFMALMLTM